MDCGRSLAAEGTPDEGRTDLARGSIESGRSTRGGCDEYRVGLSSEGEVGGSGKGEAGS
jgi:hypothetical protein